MKNLIFLVAILFSCCSLNAQNEHVVGKIFYGEFFGPGVTMSVNFDARFNAGERLGLGYRIGVGYGFEGIDDKFIEALKEFDIVEFHTEFLINVHKGVQSTFYTVPIGLNYVIGKPQRASCFEIGAGATFFSKKVTMYTLQYEKAGYAIGYLSFMYRFMPINGGFSFRAGITPIIGTAGDLFPMFAIGLGYSF